MIIPRSSITEPTADSILSMLENGESIRTLSNQLHWATEETIRSIMGHTKLQTHHKLDFEALCQGKLDERTHSNKQEYSVTGVGEKVIRVFGTWFTCLNIEIGMEVGDKAVIYSDVATGTVRKVEKI